MTISNETKIGALTAISITILILGYSFLRGADVFSGTNRFYGIYKNVDGLTVSKPVLVNGFQIGHISKMKFLPDSRTLIEFKIDDKYNVPKNTLARLESVSLLGDKAIVFQYSNSNLYAADKDTLPTDVQGGLGDSLKPIQTKAEDLIGKLDSSLASVNKILNPNFQKNVDRSFLSIANSLQTLEGITKKLDALVANQTGHINGILSNAEVLSGNLKTSSADINSITANFKKASNDLANANLKQTLDNLNKTTADLQAAISKVNSKDGTVGLLLNDTRMYDNLNNASRHMDSLLVDLKAHPGKYISFSVFGRKNK